MTDWVRMKHPGTGGHTLVPSQAVVGYERRGWEVQNDEKSALTDPAPKANPKPVRSDKVKEDPTPSPSADDNETKEDG